MPIQKIVKGFNKFQYYAKEKDLKNAAVALNEVSAAFFEFQPEKSKRNEFKSKLKEIFELLKSGNVTPASKIAKGLEDAFRLLLEPKNILTPFQMVVGSLCAENWKPEQPANKVLGFAMMTALESGLMGECIKSSPEKVLEASKNYENQFYICPLDLFGIIGGIGAPMSNMKTVILTLEMLKSSLNNTHPMKVFIVDKLRTGILRLVQMAGKKFDIQDRETFEALIAISYKFGLLYHEESQAKAIELANEFRMPNPF